MSSRLAQEYTIVITMSWLIAVEHHSVQKLHSSTITLLPFFDFFFAGSWVATIYVTSHTYSIFIENFFVYP